MPVLVRLITATPRPERAGPGNLNSEIKWIFCLTTASMDAVNQERRCQRTRRNHTPAFKAKVALAAVKGERRWPNWRSSLTFTPIS